jgi:hypothetical protein
MGTKTYHEGGIQEQPIHQEALSLDYCSRKIASNLVVSRTGTTHYLLRRCLGRESGNLARPAGRAKCKFNSLSQCESGGGSSQWRKGRPCEITFPLPLSSLHPNRGRWRRGPRRRGAPGRRRGATRRRWETERRTRGPKCGNSRRPNRSDRHSIEINKHVIIMRPLKQRIGLMPN